MFPLLNAHTACPNAATLITFLTFPSSLNLSLPTRVSQIVYRISLSHKHSYGQTDGLAKQDESKRTRTLKEREIPSAPSVLHLPDLLFVSFTNSTHKRTQLIFPFDNNISNFREICIKIFGESELFTPSRATVHIISSLSSKC